MDERLRTSPNCMKHSKGFSLIELLLVVVIIGIVAAIAIPNLISARRAANEGSAVSSLRTLFGANVSFAATAGSGRYAGTAGTVGTSSMAELYTANLIDGVLRDGEKSGYSFVGDSTLTTPTAQATFYFATNPATTTGVLATGTNRFGIGSDGVVRYDSTAAALAIPFDAATLLTAQPIGNQ